VALFLRATDPACIAAAHQEPSSRSREFCPRGSGRRTLPIVTAAITSDTVAVMTKIRLTVAYNQPPDPDAFFRHYHDVHVTLARLIPGVESFEWSKVVGTPTGEPARYALIAELRSRVRTTCV
jgi:hypothetical protein